MMMRGMLTIAPFISVILFPWPITAALVIVASFFVPLAPLAVGLFADALYYVPQTGTVPWCTLFGIVATGFALFVRRRLRAGSIGE